MGSETAASIGLIILIAIVYGFVTLVIGEGIETVLGKGAFCFFIPSVWRGTKVFNWFGAVFMTVLMHIIFLPWALGFWFWKMLTVGGNK